MYRITYEQRSVPDGEWEVVELFFHTKEHMLVQRSMIWGVNQNETEIRNLDTEHGDVSPSSS